MIFIKNLTVNAYNCQNMLNFDKRKKMLNIIAES